MSKKGRTLEAMGLLLLTYGCGAWIEMSPNPSQWHVITRLFVLALICVMIIYSLPKTPPTPKRGG